MKRKIKLTVTKLRQRRETIFAQPLSAYCRICRNETETLTTVDAGSFLETDVDSILVLIGTRKIHGFFTVNDNFRVCKNSLFK
ncbi:MAG: hypothetical protein ICV86_18805 [Microcoleus sp. T3-bin5]|nr:hypothetical protein [Microcoleus sp. T3-bin5]